MCDRFKVRSVDPQVRNLPFSVACGQVSPTLTTYLVHTNFKETTNGSSVRSAKKNVLPIFGYKKNKLFFTSGQIKKLSLLLEKINKMFRFRRPPSPPV